jgi:hypothetical protein
LPRRNGRGQLKKTLIGCERLTLAFGKAGAGGRIAWWILEAGQLENCSWRARSWAGKGTDLNEVIRWRREGPQHVVVDHESIRPDVVIGAIKRPTGRTGCDVAVGNDLV